MQTMSISEALSRKFIKRSKYGNVKTDYNGRSYHSKKEADFAMSLDLSMKDKRATHRVKSWKPQVPFPMIVKKQKICTYYLDFLVEYVDGRKEYIDVKGGDATKTDIYMLKKKLMFALYKIEIKEV